MSAEGGPFGKNRLVPGREMVEKKYAVLFYIME